MTETTAQKQRTHGTFERGQSGNPKGRPPGARNRTTILAEQLTVDGWWPATIKARLRRWGRELQAFERLHRDAHERGFKFFNSVCTRGWRVG